MDQVSTLSTASAFGLLIVYTLIYVVPLNVLSLITAYRHLSRDHPSVIKRRMISVSFSVLFCITVTYRLLEARGFDALRELGLRPINLKGTWNCLCLTWFLYQGPFVELFLDKPWKAILSDIFSPDIYTWRNIVVGPLTEELLFRSAGVPLFVAAGMPPSQIVFGVPLVFGLAHLHHFIEFRRFNPQVSFRMALLRSIFQLVYTTIFGAYVTFIYLRSGSLLAVFLVHAFCNMMGIPRFFGHVQPHWLQNTEETLALRRNWSLLYYTALIIGMYVWYQAIWPWSESSNRIIEFS